MLKSMTGYGRAQEIVDGKDITVEIKSINHRFFEYSARVPRSYGYIEEHLKTLLQSRVSRGKLEANITIYHVDAPDEEVAVNQELAADYLSVLREAAKMLKIEDDLKLSHLLSFNDIFTVRKKTDDEEMIIAAVDVLQ